MHIELHLVDAFTNERFRGNPAAVCLLDQTLPDSLLQLVAREMNLSETAFLLKSADHFALRWFTPTNEVDLCGHATLASAFALFEKTSLDRSTVVRFQTRSGILTAKRLADGKIQLDFPSVAVQETQPPEALSRGIDTPIRWCGLNSMDYLIELKNETEVRTLNPNLNLWSQLPVRGVIVTAPSDSNQFDFVSRFFAPAVGVNEDPVTGSAHCALAPYWGSKLSKTTLVGYQASARGGSVEIEWQSARVLLSGHCVSMGIVNLDIGPLV